MTQRAEGKLARYAYLADSRTRDVGSGGFREDHCCGRTLRNMLSTLRSTIAIAQATVTS